MDHDAPRFVQFPHPGGEHRPPGERMPWNLGEHGRKFLRSGGRLVDKDGRCTSVKDAAFWAEWEPPSVIEQHWPADGECPRALHSPYWFRPGANTPRQNTDPWVFGREMLYSNCRQLTPNRNRSSMQFLPRGSVICFGSTKGGEFCLDTVFVVRSAEPWTAARAAALDVDDAFRVCTAESIAASGGAHVDLTLYRGATLDDPVDGMYSFVPALPVTGDEPRPFARPVIRQDLINPAVKMSTWGSLRPMSVAQVCGAWESVRDQVLKADLMLAVALDTPPRDCPVDHGSHINVATSTRLAR